MSSHFPAEVQQGAAMYYVSVVGERGCVFLDLFFFLSILQRDFFYVPFRRTQVPFQAARGYELS